jgi:hypothetical protein
VRVENRKRSVLYIAVSNYIFLFCNLAQKTTAKR